MNDDAASRTHLIAPLIIGLAIMLALLIPLRITAYGYVPIDDAMRHAAKAISGKEWQQILVLRPDIRMDSHPGWHAVLGLVHRATGAQTDGLVAFSIVAMMSLFLVLPAFFLRRPEAWLLSLLLIFVFMPALLLRIALGRPLILSMAVVMAWCFLWQHLKARACAGAMAALTLLLALATWIHCSWYLLALPLAALVLAREWRAAARMAVCFVAGVLLGACFTGHPIEFLSQTLRHTLLSFGQNDLTRMLVTEFQPSSGDATMLLAVAGLLLWRTLRGAWDPKVIDNPVFIMAALCWVLGLGVWRFWLDWGVPVLAVWIALELQDAMEPRISMLSWRRMGVMLAACLPLFLVTTTDAKGRWTYNLTTEYLDASKPEHAAWLPEPGGIIYSDSMTVFYKTFYANPHGNWRYVLGFEPGLMAEDDLKILRNIQWNHSAWKAFAPWVKKMRPIDRMMIESGDRPGIEGLEWHYTASNVWLGKIKK